MIVSAFGFQDILGTRSNIVLDPSRIAAQVVSGIGFLGAGTILLRKEIVKGLTTAAAIWVVAAIGLACGAGLLLEASCTTIFTIIVLTALSPLRSRLRRNPQRANHAYLRVKVAVVEEALLNTIYDTCVEMGAAIQNIEIQAGGEKEKMELECTTNQAVPLAKSLVALRSTPGIDTISINLRNPSSINTPFPLFNDDDEPINNEMVKEQSTR
jgi:putative Mg2+ transporter-C (MgtC) family protein